MEENAPLGVRIITAAPEIVGVPDIVPELDQRGIVSLLLNHLRSIAYLLKSIRDYYNIATSDTVTKVIRCGARLITHLIHNLWGQNEDYK